MIIIQADILDRVNDSITENGATQLHSAAIT